METSQVRRRLQQAMTTARERARQRREAAGDAEKAYLRFLEQVAVPLARQVVNALRADGYAFTLSTPAYGLRLTSDHNRDDYVELALDTGGETATVVGRTRRARGSRTLDEERPVKSGAAPQDVTEDDLLEYFAVTLEPWLER